MSTGAILHSISVHYIELYDRLMFMHDASKLGLLRVLRRISIIPDGFRRLKLAETWQFQKVSACGIYLETSRT